MEFTEEQLSQVKTFAALNYTVRQMALCFDMSIDLLYIEYNDELSEFRKAYETGKGSATYKIDAANYENAIKGSIQAINRYDKQVRENKISAAKERIFGSR